MAKVVLNICGREHELYTRDGNEARMEELAAIIEAKASQVSQSMGALTEQRQLLFASLMLADEVDTLRKAAPPPTAAPMNADTAAALERLADRIESYADRLEADAPAS
jgi:cell division protein ZapA